MENKSGEMSFFVAFRNGDIRQAKQLLRESDPSSLSSTWEGTGIICFHVAVVIGDPELLTELAAKLRDSDLFDIIEKEDNNGDTALHYAVRKTRVDLVKQLVDLDSNLCNCSNKEGETPLKLAVSLEFKEAVGFLVTRTSNALHYIVELNQVKLVHYLIGSNIDLSKLINQPYRRTPSPPTERDRHPKEERSLTKSSSSAGDKSSQSAVRNRNKAEEGRTTKSTYDDEGNEDTNTQSHEPIVVIGDTPLHIAARNKFEHMVNLLLKVPKVNKLARNSEQKTPFEIAREVTQYHESFRTIRELAHYRWGPKPFLYCAPQVSHKKLIEARKMVKKSYEERRNAEQVVAALLATMTFAAAFSMPGGFQTENTQTEEIGSPLLISFTSFKLFLFFDCVAFFLALFVCITWQLIPVHSPGDKMLFMTGNSLLISCSFSFTAFGFMTAMYTVLARKVKIFSWVVIGSLAAITLCGFLGVIFQLAEFAVSRARFHRLCGVSSVFDDMVEMVWSTAERCGLFTLLRSNDDVSRDLISALATVESDDDRTNYSQSSTRAAAAMSSHCSTSFTVRNCPL